MIRLPRLRDRVPLLLDALARLYPETGTALDHADPLQLIVATVLSAQCTDKRVNLITPALFARYPSAAAFATADVEELESYIKTTGFYHNKAKNIIACCKALVAKHDGAVPRSLENFAVCPGVSVAINDDIEKARMPVKMHLALYIGGMGARGKNFYNDYARRLGYEEAAVRIQDLYLDGKKLEAMAAVPNQLVDEVALIGPADRIRARLGAWREAGKKRHVGSILAAGASPEAMRLLAEELL